MLAGSPLFWLPIASFCKWVSLVVMERCFYLGYLLKVALSKVLWSSSRLVVYISSALVLYQSPTCYGAHQWSGYGLGDLIWLWHGSSALGVI
ncbi:hypothetical protein U1Q18_039243 [Sarracenia purpurea var. burkii]